MAADKTGWRRKLPSEVRKEAADMARRVADQRSKDGDPEGSDVIRELAADIEKISLLESY